MKRINAKVLFVFLLLSCLFNQSYSQTVIEGGNLPITRWTKALSPYYINVDFKIPESENLIIDPGVEVIFTGNYELIVYGGLIVAGTKKYPVIFTSSANGGWKGITIESLKEDSIIIDFCEINKSRNSGLTIKSNKTRISNCHIYENSSHNGGGITCISSSPRIYKNRIEKNKASRDGGGIYCSNSSAEISFNAIKENYAGGAGGGIRVDKGHAIIANNVIANNEAGSRAGGFEAAWGYLNTNCLLINNTIVKNRAMEYGGVYSWRGKIKCVNNVIWGNTNGNIGANSPVPIVTYCAIEGGLNNTWSSNIISLNKDNMSVKDGAMFKNPDNDDFTPLRNSPLIGNGTPKGITIGHTGKTNFQSLFKIQGTIIGNKKGGKIEPLYSYSKKNEKLIYRVVVNDGYKVLSAKHNDLDVTKELKETSFGYLYSIKKNKKNGEFVIEIAESTPLYENSSQGFSIFHNALKKNVTIETENQINICIKDAEGKTVKNEQLFQVLKSKVNTDELPPGEYFIDIKIGDKVSTKKIMVK